LLPRPPLEPGLYEGLAATKDCNCKVEWGEAAGAAARCLAVGNQGNVKWLGKTLCITTTFVFI